MFGLTKAVLARIEELKASVERNVYKKDMRIEALERQLQDVQTWGSKWREKAKRFRRERRDLRAALKIHEGGESSNSAG